MARQQGDYQQNMDDVRRNVRRVVDWFRRYPLSLFFLFLLLIVMLTAPTMIYRVNADQEAVVLRFGKFTEQVGPGLHTKFPFPIERAYIVDTRKVFSEEFGYRPENERSRTRRPDQTFNRESLMLTGDLGVARVEWQVQYRKTNPKKYLFNISNVTQVIRENTLATMRRIIGDKFVSNVITTARGAIRQDVKKELQKVMDQYNAGITIDAVELQATEPPAEKVISAFKEVDSARQERETFRNEALREKERVLNEVQGKKAQQISEARGKKAAIVNKAKGEAKRFENLIQQYKAAPEITETRMFLETMQDVIDRSERVYVIDRQVKGLLPHLNLRSAENK